MLQRLHPGVAAIDVLTRSELDAGLHEAFDDAVRTRYRGVDTARIPRITAAGTGSTVNIGSGQQGSDGIAGPEQGDVWMIRRILVASSALTTDAAKYILFRGSSPSDPGAYNSNFLLDGMQANTLPTTLTAPLVPASGVAAQNTSSQPYTVVITGGTATVTTVNGVVVGAGDGTYVVPAYGSIAVTYSVVPTWTWTATQSGLSVIGAQVGIAYNPGNKAVFVYGGEQIYAQVFGTTVGNTYTLSGEAIRVPGEMKGKVL